MPYAGLPEEANRIFEEVYKKVLKEGRSKESAARIAWTAVKNAGYRRGEEGKWVKARSEIAEFSMTIVKTSYDKEHQVMRWRSVNSDTDPDLFGEQMSVELFQDFIRRVEERTPVPDPFRPIVCEESWCGGMPYLSIAHFRCGKNAKNVPGTVEAIYLDGERLKSIGALHDTPLGRSVFSALNRDLYARKSNGEPLVPPDRRVRISIGFLDLTHKHVLENGVEEIFTRTDVGQICPLCLEGVGRKIYMSGQLVHLALTRVPVNPRTLVEVEKSMGEIVTKKDDAASIVGDELAKELEEKALSSEAGEVVNRASEPASGLVRDDNPMEECYDPNTDSYNQDCVDRVRGNMKEESAVEERAVTKSEEWGDEPASSYLVVGDPKHPTTWHLPVKKHGKPDHRLMAAARAALTSNHRGKAYQGPNKEEALRKLKALYRSEGMDWGNENKSMAEMEAAVDAGGDGNAILEVAKEIAQRALELKEKGATGKDAERELQPLLNRFGEQIERTLSGGSPVLSSDVLAKVIRASVEEAIAPLAREIAVLKAKLEISGDGGTKSPYVPRARSLSISGADVKPQRELSQIERIARRTVGLPD